MIYSAFLINLLTTLIKRVQKLLVLFFRPIISSKTMFFSEVKRYRGTQGHILKV